MSVSDDGSAHKPNFSDALAKLKRADKHIADLETGIAGFLRTDFYRLRLEPNHREGRVKVLFDSLHEPDKSLNLIIGDAISNMRSALDYAVVAATNEMKAEFPFGDDAANFVGQVKNGAIGRFGDKLVQLFVDKVQAHGRGYGEAIWTLNKLRNIDKHRLLLTTVEIARIKVSFRHSSGMVLKDNTFGIKAGASGTIAELPGGFVEFTDQPTPSFAVLLREPPIVESEPAVDLLKRISKSTKECLVVVEEFFK